jgi:hypothetical protein
MLLSCPRKIFKVFEINTQFIFLQQCDKILHSYNRNKKKQKMQVRYYCSRVAMVAEPPLELMQAARPTLPLAAMAMSMG